MRRERAQAFEDVVLAIREMARSRGHSLGPRSAIEAECIFTMTCAMCGRAVTFDLGPDNTLYPSVSGGALAKCRGKTYDPVQAQPMNSGESNRLA